MTFTDYIKARNACPGCGGKHGRYVTKTPTIKEPFGKRVFERCSPCHGTGNAIVYKHIELDVPEGYIFNINKELGTYWFYKKGLHGQTVLERKLPHKIGDQDKVVCDVCGGGKRDCGEESCRGCWLYGGDECRAYIYCTTCNGKPEITREVVSLKVEGKTLIVGRLEV